MAFLESLRTHMGRWMLRRQRRRGTVISGLRHFSELNEIGILYRADQKQEEEAVHHFAAKLREEGKKVFLLGYVHSKQLPHTKKIHITSEFFWKEKLNFFNLPDKIKIGRFLDTPFDLLMNIYFDELLPMQAISVYSKAKYRISAQNRHALQYSDAVIDTGSNHDIYYLASQMEYYLRVIK